MKPTDATFLECKLSADAAPYLYGELAEKEIVAFESHLLSCTACTDEFAAIASARYEVYDWKKVEFDPISTPSFDIPYAAEVVLSSWSDRLKATFARGWAVPATAFAGLAIVSIFTGWVLLSEGNSDVATIVGDSNISNEATVMAAPSIPSPVREDAPVVKDPPLVEAGLNETEIPTRAIQRTPVRAAKPTARRTIEAKQASTRAVTESVPRLDSFPEDEDTSLRLAELLEDGETRD